MERPKFNIEALADLDHLTAEVKAAAQSIIVSFPGLFAPSAPDNDIAEALEIGLTLPDSKAEGYQSGDGISQVTVANPLLTTIGFPLDMLTLRFCKHDRGRWSLDAHIEKAQDNPDQISQEVLTLDWSTAYLGSTRRHINDWLLMTYKIGHEFFPPINYQIMIDHYGVRKISSFASPYFEWERSDMWIDGGTPRPEDYGPLQVLKPRIGIRDNLAIIHFAPSPQYQGAGHLGEVNLLVPVKLEMVKS